MYDESLANRFAKSPTRMTAVTPQRCNAKVSWTVSRRNVAKRIGFYPVRFAR
jgi:hypothetical protein